MMAGDIVKNREKQSNADRSPKPSSSLSLWVIAMLLPIRRSRPRREAYADLWKMTDVERVEM